MGNATTPYVPGRAVTLIHGVAEAKVVPLKLIRHTSSEERPVAWNETFPTLAARSTYAAEKLSTISVSSGTTMGEPELAAPKYSQPAVDEFASTPEMPYAPVSTSGTVTFVVPLAG